MTLSSRDNCNQNIKVLDKSMDHGMDASVECVAGNTEEPQLKRTELPFSFTPQLVHLHKDHELFEVT